MTLFLVSTEYNYKTNNVVLRFYDTETDKFKLYDDKKYLPYCLAKEKEHLIALHPRNITTVEKYDSLNDKTVVMYKGELKDANELRATESYAKTWAEEGLGNPLWENKLKTQMSYIYDNQIGMGMPFKIGEDGTPVFVADKDAESRIDKIIKLFEGHQHQSIIRDLTKLFEYPVPKFKRCSVDIEVYNELNKFPLPEIANNPIICVCILTSDDRKIALLLKQDNKKFDKYPNCDELHIFSEEKDLILKTFDLIREYPIVLTFNGDDFDLKYLRNRACRLEIPSYKIPIYKVGNATYIKDVIHIDLMKFFSIEAIKNYAFGGKYKNVGLDEVSLALLNKNKLNQEHKIVAELSYYDLVNYCMQDNILTLELSQFDNDLVMNLIMAISRISRLPIEECSRRAVGNWIASFLFNLHRKLDYLIPRPEDIITKKGSTSSTSKVKGKQFEAAIVFDVIQGIHFGAKVIDFSSLYPSIIKLKNIGYSSVKCQHGNVIKAMSIDTKKFIYIVLSTLDGNLWSQTEKIKLMKNIELDVMNQSKDTESKIENPLENINKNIIESLYQTLLEKNNYMNASEKTQENNIMKIQNCTEKKEENGIIKIKNVAEKEIKNGLKITEVKEENTIENTQIIIDEKLKKNLSHLKVQNVNDVVNLMNELSKYTMSMEENKKNTIFMMLLKNWIGQNYNSFIQIAIQLSQSYDCYSNTFGNLPHWVCTKKPALESLFIGSLRDLRVEHYKRKAKDKNIESSMLSWYKVVEQVIKVFMNASYGVFSTNPNSNNKPDEFGNTRKGEGFAFLCPPASELIAGIARMTTIATAEHAKELGLTILGGDTDSLFVLGDNSKIMELQEWCKKQFNIELTLEKETRFMGFSNRKKNYIIVLPDGTKIEKGLTGKKKHTPKYFKTYYKQVLDIICAIENPSDVPTAKKKIIAIVKEGYNRIKNHKWDNINDLAFHITMDKEVSSYKKNLPQHVKAVMKLMKAGYDFGVGSEISFVKTYKSPKTNPEGVMPIELAKDVYIDAPKYIATFKSTMIQLLDMFCIDWDRDILGSTTLDCFS